MLSSGGAYLHVKHTPDMLGMLYGAGVQDTSMGTQDERMSDGRLSSSAVKVAREGYARAKMTAVVFECLACLKLHPNPLDMVPFTVETTFTAGAGHAARGAAAVRPAARAATPSCAPEAVLSQLQSVAPAAYEVLALVTAMWPDASRDDRPALKVKVWRAGIWPDGACSALLLISKELHLLVGTCIGAKATCYDAELWSRTL